VSGYQQGYDTNGLVSYWSMDSVSGTNVFDDFGSNDGTTVGTPTFSAGKNNNAVDFVGSGQYIKIDNINSRLTNTNYSIFMWIYANDDFNLLPSGIASEQIFFSKPPNFNFGGLGYKIDTDTDRLQFYCFDNSGGVIANTFGSNTAWDQNKWYNIGVVFDGTNIIHYLNGFSDSITAETDTIATYEYFYTIGAGGGNDFPQYFNGQIDEVAIYDRALSSNEVATLYNDNVGKFYPDSVTSNQLAHYILDTAWDYDATLAHDTNLLARAEYWDYTAGHEDVLFALDTENLGVASGQEVDTAVIRDISWNAREVSASWDFITNGLINYYSMDTVAGTTVSDDYGTNDATNIGTATFTAGTNNNAVTLNGSSQYLDRESGIAQNKSEITISAWVNVSDFADVSPVVSENNISGSRLEITCTSTRQLRLGGRRLDSDSFTIFAVSGTGIVSPQSWTHVVGVYDGSGATVAHKVYVDGIDVTSTAAGTIGAFENTSTTSQHIGLNNTTSGKHFKGQIDEVAIYNRALSSNEVSTIYNNGTGKFYTP